MRSVQIAVWALVLGLAGWGIFPAADADPLEVCIPWTPYTHTPGDAPCITREVKNTSSASNSEQTVTVTYANGTSTTTTLPEGGALVIKCKVIRVDVHEQFVPSATATFGAVASSGTTSRIERCKSQIVYTSDGEAGCVSYTLTNTGASGSSVSVSTTYADGSSDSRTLLAGQSTSINCNITSISVHETHNASTVIELDD